MYSIVQLYYYGLHSYCGIMAWHSLTMCLPLSLIMEMQMDMFGTFFLIRRRWTPIYEMWWLWRNSGGWNINSSISSAPNAWKPMFFPLDSWKHLSSCIALAWHSHNARHASASMAAKDTFVQHSGGSTCHWLFNVVCQSPESCCCPPVEVVVYTHKGNGEQVASGSKEEKPQKIVGSLWGFVGVWRQQYMKKHQTEHEPWWYKQL